MWSSRLQINFIENEWFYSECWLYLRKWHWWYGSNARALTRANIYLVICKQFTTNPTSQVCFTFIFVVCLCYFQDSILRIIILLNFFRKMLFLQAFYQFRNYLCTCIEMIHKVATHKITFKITVLMKRTGRSITKIPQQVWYMQFLVYKWFNDVK